MDLYTIRMILSGWKGRGRREIIFQRMAGNRNWCHFEGCCETIKMHSAVSTIGGCSGGRQRERPGQRRGRVRGSATPVAFGGVAVLTLFAPGSRDQQSALENPRLADWIFSTQITPSLPAPPRRLSDAITFSTNPITLVPLSHIVNSVTLLTKCCGPILPLKSNRQTRFSSNRLPKEIYLSMQWSPTHPANQSSHWIPFQVDGIKSILLEWGLELIFFLCESWRFLDYFWWLQIYLSIHFEWEDENRYDLIQFDENGLRSASNCCWLFERGWILVAINR